MKVLPSTNSFMLREQLTELLRGSGSYKDLSGTKKKSLFMSGSSHIRSVLIGVEYRNYRLTLDVYLLFAIWMGQIQSKTDLHICNL